MKLVLKSTMTADFVNVDGLIHTTTLYNVTGNRKRKGRFYLPSRFTLQYTSRGIQWRTAGLPPVYTCRQKCTRRMGVADPCNACNDWLIVKVCRPPTIRRDVANMADVFFMSAFVGKCEHAQAPTHQFWPPSDNNQKECARSRDANRRRAVLRSCAASNKHN